MDIMELGAIGELVGGVAVIGSLIYVGLQVRQIAQATRAASHHATINSLREWGQPIVREGAVADIFLRGNTDPESLSQQEQLQYSLLVFSLLRIYETVFYQSGVGTGERQILRSEEANLRWLFSHPGVQHWWRAQPFSLSEGRTS